MKKEFIPYELALILKELGFDLICFMAYYHLSNKEEKDKLFSRYNDNNTNSDNSISAPLYQQAFRWFREKYGMYGDITRDKDQTELFTFFITTSDNVHPISICFKEFNNYEEAELACIRKLISIVKEE